MELIYMTCEWCFRIFKIYIYIFFIFTLFYVMHIKWSLHVKFQQLCEKNYFIVKCFQIFHETNFIYISEHEIKDVWNKSTKKS